MNRSTLAFLFVLTSASFAFAQTPKLQAEAPRRPLTLEQVQRLQELEAQRRELDDAMREIDRIEATFHEIANQTRTQCLAAIGEMTFCDCLSQHLPVGATFASYVSALISPKADLATARQAMDADVRAVLDGILKAREQCVTAAFGLK